MLNYYRKQKIYKIFNNFEKEKLNPKLEKISKHCYKFKIKKYTFTIFKVENIILFDHSRINLKKEETQYYLFTLKQIVELNNELKRILK